MREGEGKVEIHAHFHETSYRLLQYTVYCFQTQNKNDLIHQRAVHTVPCFANLVW